MQEGDRKTVTLVPGGVSVGFVRRARNLAQKSGSYAGLSWLCAWLLLCGWLPVCGARTLKDEMGRTVTVPEHPHRLLCLAPSVVDTVYALGAGTDVIAVTDFVKYPAEAKSKPSVGQPLTPSLERIVSLHPDLVLGYGQISQMETIQRLEQLGIPVYLVSPHGVEGIYRSIASVGQALNRESSAQALVAKLRAREAAVRRRVSGKPLVSILMPIWYDPVVTIGKNAFITELIAMAGGRSVTADLPQEWPQISLESVVARKPEALLLERGSKVTLEQILTRPGWSKVPAIQNQRIYYVGDQIEISSPIAFDALEDLARQLHP